MIKQQCKIIKLIALMAQPIKPNKSSTQSHALDAMKCPFSILPSITHNRCSQGKQEFEQKQSDFIRKMKRAKSIMLAHRKRKQKIVMQSYFMSPLRKSGIQKPTSLHDRVERSSSQDINDSLPLWNSVSISTFERQRPSEKVDIVRSSPIDLGAFIRQEANRKQNNKQKGHGKQQTEFHQQFPAEGLPLKKYPKPLAKCFKNGGFLKNISAQKSERSRVINGQNLRRYNTNVENVLDREWKIERWEFDEEKWVIFEKE